MFSSKAFDHELSCLDWCNTTHAQFGDLRENLDLRKLVSVDSGYQEGTGTLCLAVFLPSSCLVLVNPGCFLAASSI